MENICKSYKKELKTYFLCWERVFLSVTGCPQSCSLDQAHRKVRDVPASL